jgi:uncharacterized membrane protein
MTSRQTIQQSDVLLALIVEGTGIGVLTLLAGISDDVGTVIVVFMTGLFLLFLINHQNFQSYITNVLARTQGVLNG